MIWVTLALILALAGVIDFAHKLSERRAAERARIKRIQAQISAALEPLFEAIVRIGKTLSAAMAATMPSVQMAIDQFSKVWGNMVAAEAWRQAHLNWFVSGDPDRFVDCEIVDDGYRCLYHQCAGADHCLRMGCPHCAELIDEHPELWNGELVLPKTEVIDEAAPVTPEQWGHLEKMGHAVLGGASTDMRVVDSLTELQAQAYEQVANAYAAPASADDLRAIAAVRKRMTFVGVLKGLFSKKGHRQRKPPTGEGTS